MQSIHHLLQSLEQKELYQSQRQFKRLLAYWPSLVGEVVADHTRPVSIQRDRLQVATASAAWAQNLSFERRRLLRKINATLNLQLQDIRFTTARWNETSPRPRTSSLTEVWANHPSRWLLESSDPPPSNSSQPPAIASTLPASDPIAAFNHWATAIQRQSAAFTPCPACQAPTPPGELQRWQCCALCAAQRWS